MKERKVDASCYKSSACGLSAEGMIESMEKKMETNYHILSAYISVLELLAKCIRPFPTNN